MSNIQTIPSFSFHNNSIRVQGTTDNPLFCLADVCKVLALSTPAKTVAQIKEEFNIRGELNSYLVKDANNHTQTATFITEPQLYFVMMRSRAKVARDFRQWVVNEVLPMIRKTGTYSSSGYYRPDGYIHFRTESAHKATEVFDYLQEHRRAFRNTAQAMVETAHAMLDQAKHLYMVSEAYMFYEDMLKEELLVELEKIKY